MRGYFWIGFIDFILRGKNLLDCISLVYQNGFENKKCN